MEDNSMPRKSLVTAKQDAAGEWQDTQDMTPCQDGMENAENSQTAPGIRLEGGENMPVLQTEIVNEPDSSAGPAEGGENLPLHQTEIENGLYSRAEPAEGVANTPAPQTEIESGSEQAGSAIGSPLKTGISPACQDGIENGDANTLYSSNIGTSAHVDNNNPGSQQDGMENQENLTEGLIQPPLQPDNSPAPQDGIGNAQNLAEKAPDLYTSGGKHAPLQTGPGEDAELNKKPGPKPRKRNILSHTAGDAETGADIIKTNPEPAKPARRIKPKPSPVLAIDEERTVETSADRMRNDLLDLVESQKSHKILSGTIQGVERSADNPDISFAVIYHGAFKVIIPAEEAVEPPDDFRDRTKADVMHYLVTKRLGAEVDFIVKGIDPGSGVAAASRLEAMAMKRKQYYFGTDRDGNNLIYEDLSAEARVVSVIRAGVFVELFGIEAYIPLRELSYQRWIDAAAHFQAGQRVLVKIIKLDRGDRGNIRVIASVKQAGENPYEQALKRYSPGSRYVGTVSMVDTNGVFVSLDGGIDCLCPYPKRGRPPRGARVTVRIIGVNHDSNRIWGAITHMATAR
jgi:hypothetical protein